MSDEIQNNQKNVVEQLEESSIKELDALREENNNENEKVVEDAEKKLSDIIEELRQKIRENSDPEKIKENMSKSHEKVKELLETTREKAIEVSNSDHFKQTIDASKDLLEGATGMIGDGLKAGADLLKTNENVADLLDKANSRLDVLRESEGLKKGVDAAEEITNKVNDAIFSGFKKFFDKKDGDDTK